MLNAQAEAKAARAYTPGIDVVVRLHDLERTQEFDRALFSLVNQTFRPVRPIVVTQNFTPGQLETVHAIVGRYEWGILQAEPTVINVEGPPGRDLRSKLINEGFAAARHRFLAILDFDDYVYEHAYQHLTAEALRSRAALAFGRIVVKHIRAFRNSVYTVRTLREMYRGTNLKDLVDDNFCPIHSFVIDRSVVTAEDLLFDETMTRLEDYDFLLRLSMKYEFSFAGLSLAVGVYNWRLDGSNSIQTWQKDEEKSRANKAAWDIARQHINRTKEKVRASEMFEKARRSAPT